MTFLPGEVRILGVGGIAAVRGLLGMFGRAIEDVPTYRADGRRLHPMVAAGASRSRTDRRRKPRGAKAR